MAKGVVITIYSYMDAFIHVMGVGILLFDVDMMD